MTRRQRHIERARHRLNRYDHLDRRVQKITPAATHTYFYDGWMLIKEIVANTNGTTEVIEYHWGKDLSGTIGGAGGVGGLLYISVSNSSTPNSSTHQLYVPWYDAYGNIIGYWDAQGNVVAAYTYDAFGKLISSSGPMANVFSFRYSTKYFDPETGFYYYGYRYYSPELMRWITRDPIGEEGGVNLYAMCRNRPVEMYDYLGLKWNIRRSGGKFAYAIADSESDTFQGLANIVELDSSDYMKWAHTKDATPRKCKVYLIPNLKVYHKGVRRFYENLSYNIIGDWDAKNDQQMLKDRKDGFKVVLKNSISDMDVWSDLGSDGLYEYTFTGHGKGGSIGAESNEFPVGPKRITAHGIHKLTLQACDSFNDTSKQKNVLAPGWAANVATVGTFVGYVGDVRLLLSPENRKRSRSGTNSGDIIIIKGTNK